ncbi:MAG TPA: maleylpyruvate isomerase N-terminal domain-containing protein [Actinocrinis sp.]|jgi:hypothetical protein
MNGETTIRHIFIEASAAGLDLVRDERVAARWDEPSALAQMTVGGLAAHLAGQTLFVPPALAEPLGEGEPVGLMDHFAAAAWVGTGPDGEANRGIRERSQQMGEDGPQAVIAQYAAALDELRAALPKEPVDRLVQVRAGKRGLDDYLATRVLEIVVHADDLAVSLGDQDGARLPEAAVSYTVALLAQLAVRRHGQAAVIRALSRAERAPDSVVAI